tara:strand:- start:130 stop:480 length:351 start_codon:yes stop_codon:yes gene_type:complete
MKFLISIAVLLALTEGVKVKPNKNGQLGVYDIHDADGDGVEDNVKKSRDDLDMFYYPNVMGEAGMDVENTRHGGLPGHITKEWMDLKTPAPEDTYSLVKKPVFHSVNTQYDYDLDA